MTNPYYAGAQGTHKFLKAIGQAITEAFEMTFGYMTGFVLITFDFDKPGVGNYISNAKRSDIIIALREAADRLEKGEDIPPTIGTA